MTMEITSSNAEEIQGIEWQFYDKTPSITTYLLKNIP